MSSESSTSKTAVVTGGCGSSRGGASGSPAMTETANRHANTNAIRRLFTEVTPFTGLNEQGSIVPDSHSAEALFAHVWRLHTSNDPLGALEACDTLLEVIDPADFPSHVRQANARGMALRALARYRESRSVHLAARPLLGAVNVRIRGDHFHGLGLSLKGLSEHVRAFKALEEARALYREAGDAYRLGLVNVNTARLYVQAGRPGLAYGYADKGAEVESLRADAEIARALAYEAEGDRKAARRSIASALMLLADSENEATRREALAVMARIEEGEG